MPTVADYDVVTDGKTTIPPNPAILPLGFGPEIDFAVRSVLSYMVYPGKQNGMTYKMVIHPGGHEIVPSTKLGFQSGHVRQEVIDGGVLTANSTLEINVSDGDGAFSDIVLMHQSDI